ncbi:hypothetical protein AB835_09390 [Candidatus Endobugula sertula]|uniref:Pyruvate carboxyltransferase domain-containing protein n=1 Tax=Candidatus Endobugula sertula TaxID=62101 RepID=A0A1D2QP46_9GAMM|nr:hypothetical protein AB835_09390 [Candidatus Endobugula sertula]
MGHQGFYLKSASGRLEPDFVYQLTTALYKNFPDQDITIHAHSTYGEAPACYMAAVKAATEQDKTITIDVQHQALSGSTAQPSMSKMVGLIRNHSDEKIRANTPKLSIKAIKESMKSLFGLRFQYREYESSYNLELIQAMYNARTPGGASATLKSIPGLVENLGRLLGKNGQPADWDTIQIEIYKMQAQILDDLGQPTQVTPYAANTTGQAAISLWHELEGRDRYHTLYPGIVNYLSGRHGKVSDSVNPELVQKALSINGLKHPEEYIMSTERPDALPVIKEKLIEAGIQQPTMRQMLSATLLEKGVDYVVSCENGTNTPQQPPALPFYAQEPAPLNQRHLAKDGKTPIRDIRDAISAIGGASVLQEVAERALHIKQIADDLYIFPSGTSNLKEKWYTENVSRLAQLLDSIPKILKDAGFSYSQRSVITGVWGDLNVDACMKDAVDQKGKGLYEFMTQAIKEHNMAKTAEPTQSPTPLKSAADIHSHPE